MGIDITSMIFTILSFIATVGVTLTLFWIERRNQKKRDEKEKEYRERREKEELEYRERREQEELAYRERREREELEQKARDFISNNSEELEYLTIAQLAVYLHPHVKHCRKIYNEFNRIYSNKLRQEILKQAETIDLNLNALDKETFMDRLLELFKIDAKTLGLMQQDFLYEDAKYLHRGFSDWGHIRISGNFEEDKRNGALNEDNYFDKKYYCIDKKNNYNRYEKYWIYRRLIYHIQFNNAKDKKQFYEQIKEEPNQLYKNKYYCSIPNTYKDFEEMYSCAPIDWYCNFTEICSEYEYAYITMELLRQATFVNQRELNIELVYPVKSDVYIERNEDLYYSTLLNLYCLYADKI